MQQGPYVPYPNIRPKEIDFGVISEGWGIIKDNLGPFIVGSIILGVIVGAIEAVMMGAVFALIGAPPTASGDLDKTFGYMLKEYAIIIPGSLVMMALMAPVMLSFNMMAFKHIRREPISVGDFALGFRFMGRAAGTYGLVYLCTMVANIIPILGPLWVSGRLMLALPSLAAKEGSIGDSLRESWELTGPHMWMALLFYFVVTLVSGLGIIACCVGVLVTIPIASVCTSLVYRDLSGMTEAIQPQSFESPAPPPTNP